ncbi:MAG TPA: hypothetical protein VFI34_10725 [Candidatus Limnocylindrales bacterium]|nr:hypothetical protein [Candidatus Limnocylindrales bacterium]
MEPNLAALLIAGGARTETRADQREREHRLALLVHRHRHPEPGLVTRLARRIRPLPTSHQPACCPA